MDSYIFPLRQRPTASYHASGRQFGAGRRGGRKHAGCDLIAPRGTEIFAIADGKVTKGPYLFYSGTYALEVTLDDGKVVRYGEILKKLPPDIKLGSSVRQGQVIAYVGRLESGGQMLHFEMYKGTKSGRLTVGGTPFRRRADLMDPTDILDNAPLSGEKPQPDTEELPGVMLRTARVLDTFPGTLGVLGEPSNDADIIFELTKGDSCTVLGDAWYEVERDGLRGFVSGHHLEIGDVVEGLPASLSEVVTKGRVSNEVTTVLNARAKPAPAARKVFTYSAGDIVNVLEEVVGEVYEWDRKDWLKVERRGEIAYVAGYYVTIGQKKQPEGTTEKKVPDGRWEAAMLDAPTRGASGKTARQDNLKRGGVTSSRKMAENDLDQVYEIAGRFVSVAGKFGVPAALLAAIASRESRCGKLLRDGWGDNHNAFGIMQVDKRYHTILGKDDPASLEHIEQAAGILSDYLQQVMKKHPDWKDKHLIKGATVAYNAGVKNVQTISKMDKGTTGDDYGSDVIARARYYYNHESLGILRS